MAEFVAGLDYPIFVVTVADPGTGQRAGCLVGFATQASIDPLRFLICLSKTNHTYRVASNSQLLAVHALEAGQHDLAGLFGQQTGDEVDKFSQCRWTAGPEETPLLDDCPHRLLGRVLDRFDFGDHTGYLLSPLHQTGTTTPPLMLSAVHDLDAGHPA